MGLVLALRSVWSRYGLRALEYERHLSAHRVPWGERIDLDLVVRNGKPLPLPWLQIDDTVTHGAEIVGRSLSPSTQQGFDVLRQTWSIGWFERVTRRLQIVGTRRGAYRFTSAELRVADLFASTRPTAKSGPLATSYRVVPRIVPVRSGLANSPARNGEGDARPVRGPVALRRRAPLPAGRPDAPDPLEGDGPPRASR